MKMQKTDTCSPAAAGSRYLLAALVILLILSGPAWTQEVTEEAEEETPLIEEMPHGMVDWESEVVRATGIGFPPEFGAPAKRKLLAKRAATADAYRNLAEIVHGVRVDSETVVKNYETESDIVRIQISGLIKGARIIEAKPLPDKSFQVTLELPIYGESSIAQAIIPEIMPKAEVAAPRAIPEGGYTGLIVDAQGLNIEPAMSPKIIDSEGKELYGTMEIDPDYVIAHGIVDYATSMAKAMADDRAGVNPIVIKGLKAGGDAFKANIIVDVDEANKVRRANEDYHFLNATNVIIVI